MKICEFCQEAGDEKERNVRLRQPALFLYFPPHEMYYNKIYTI